MLIRATLLAMVILSPAQAGECDGPGRAAEQELGLPAGLLAAIGRVESGVRDASGVVAAWPWSINAGGQGYYLRSPDEAVALVATLQAQGVRSIDVGCFQVNLQYHPGAFASVAQAFDPAANAMAAGRFLRGLHAGAPGWEDAVARYHSASPGLGLPYLRQVMASWSGGAAVAAAPVPRVAALVRVIVPHDDASWTALPAGRGRRLPVVITPSHTSL